MEWTYNTIEHEGFEFQIAKNNKQGPDILIIGSAIYYPRVISKELSENFSIHCIDHRGFAKRITDSKENVQEYNLTKIIEDIEIIRKLIGLQNFILLGHSGHGYMALAYAAIYPIYISHLILVSTGPSHGIHLSENQRYFETFASKERKEKHKSLQELFKRNIEENPIDFFRHYCVSQDALGFYDLRMDSNDFWDGIVTNKLAFDHLFGETFAEIKVEDYLKQINIQITIVMGKFDFQVAPYFTWDPILNNFPNVKFKVFQKSAHLPFYEEPSEFKNQIINPIIKKVIL